MPRLPIPGSDDGNWGTILNEFLGAAHDNNGNLKAGSVGAAALASASVSAAQLSTPAAPTNGQVLSYNGSGLAWAAASGGSAPDADASTKGLVQLAGDLSGTAASPTVASGAITASKIAPGTITNTEINASAAIAQSKVAGLTTSLGTKIDSTEKGAANGVATLTAGSVLTAAQIPANIAKLDQVGTVSAVWDYTTRPTINDTPMRDYLDAGEFGWTPAASAATNDAAIATAVAAARSQSIPLYLGRGEFHISAPIDLRATSTWGSGLVIFGAGRELTAIVQDTNAADIMRVGGFACRYADFSLRHANTNPDATTGHGVVFYKSAYSIFERLQIENCGNIMYIAQENVNDPGTASGSSNWMFSNTFTDLLINRYGISGLHLEAFTARATGSVWTNVYIQNRDINTGDPRTSTGAPVTIFQTEDSVFNQLNIEDALDVGIAVLVNSGGWITINGLHLERVSLGQFNSQYIRVYGSSGLIINGLHVNYCDVASSSGSGRSALASVELGARLDIRGISVNNLTKTVGGRRFTIAEVDDVNAANSVEVTYVVALSSVAFDADTDSGANTGMKRIGDTFYNITVI